MVSTFHPHCRHRLVVVGLSVFRKAERDINGRNEGAKQQLGGGPNRDVAQATGGSNIALHQAGDRN